MTRKNTNTGKSVLGTLLFTIWALPGIGIPTLLILLQHRKRARNAVTTAPNTRGQYG